MNAPYIGQDSAEKHRSTVVDMAKGIAIVLVVYGHCLRGLVSANLVPSGSWLATVDYMIYTFHMPIFFVLSGLFFAASAQKNRSTFWLSRFKTIVYPYFLWSLIQGGMQIALSGSGAVNQSIGKERILAILWAPLSPFWFLYALFFCNVIAFALIRVRTSILVAVAFVAFLVSFLHGVIEDVAYGFLYFTLGRLATERGWMRRVPSSWPVVTMLAGLFVAAALACDVARVPERLAFPAAFFGIAATLALCAGLEKTPSAKWLSRSLTLVGQCSMAIYVMHILLLGLVRTVVVRFFHIYEPIVLMPLEISIATLVPIVIQLVAVHLNFNELVGLPSSAWVGKRMRPA